MKKHISHKKNEPLWSELLTRAEAVQLLRHFKPNGQSGFTEAEAGLLWKWAEEIRKNNAILELALAGSLETSLRDNEIVVRAYHGALGGGPDAGRGEGIPNPAR